MVKTRVFIASASDRFTADNQEIENFMLRLNACFIDKEIFIKPIISDRTADAAAYRNDLADSDSVFFLLNADTGECIREMYKTARDSYNKTGKPKISVYIKTTGDEPQDNVELLTQKLDYDFKQYYSIYTHIDTLKLGILMQIKQLGLSGVDIRLEDGKAWQDGNVLLSLEDVASVSGYENLQNLKRKLVELEDRYYTAKSHSAENPDDTAAYEELQIAVMRRGETLKEVKDIEAGEKLLAHSQKMSISESKEDMIELLRQLGICNKDLGNREESAIKTWVIEKNLKRNSKQRLLWLVHIPKNSQKPVVS